MGELQREQCQSCRGGTPPLSREEAGKLLQEVPGWELEGDGKMISRSFRFKDYYQTIAFVNAVAWISHREDHHPDLEVHFNRCTVRYSTHVIGGLSRNDFICAAKVGALLP